MNEQNRSTKNGDAGPESACKPKTKNYIYVRACSYSAPDSDPDWPQTVIGFAYTHVKASDETEAYLAGEKALPIPDRNDILDYNDLAIELT